MKTNKLSVCTIVTLFELLRHYNHYGPMLILLRHYTRLQTIIIIMALGHMV